MALPTFANYVTLLWTLFDRFVQSGHPRKAGQSDIGQVL
jgi:hypothetical protein